MATPSFGPAGPTGHPSSGPSASAAPDAVVRIPLSGAAPDALVLDGDRAWVLAGEGGTLMEVDLAEARELRSIEVGFGATHLAVLDDDIAAVARFDDSGNGSYLVLVDLRSRGRSAVSRPARSAGSRSARTGSLWALEQADRLVKVDARAGRDRR